MKAAKHLRDVSLILLTLAAGARGAEEEQTLVETSYDLKPVLKTLGDSGRERPPLRSAKDIVRSGAGMGREQAVEMLQMIVTETIDRGSWKNGGGHGTAKAQGAKLVVKQTAARQEQIAALIDRLAKPMRLTGAAKPGAAPTVLPNVIVVDLAGVRAGIAGPGKFPVTDPDWQERLVQRIMDAVPKDSWVEKGGKDGSVRSLGSLLVIRQTPENLRTIETSLREWANEK